MKKITLLWLLIITTVVFSCHKETPTLSQQSEEACKDAVVFSRVEPMGPRFFSGKIDGKGFCVSEGVGSYNASNGIWTGFVTSTQNPVLSPGATPTSSWYQFSINPPVVDPFNGLLQELAPYVYIRTPTIFDSTVLKPSQYIDKFIKKGDLPLRRNFYKESDSRFDFTIGWRCDGLKGYYENSPGYTPSAAIYIVPWTGAQDNLVFRVSEFEKIATDETITYNTTFEIECNLYYQNPGLDYDYYGRLTEGVFKTQVVLTKDQ